MSQTTVFQTYIMHSDWIYQFRVEDGEVTSCAMMFDYLKSSRDIIEHAEANGYKLDIIEYAPGEFWNHYKVRGLDLRGPGPWEYM